MAKIPQRKLDRFHKLQQASMRSVCRCHRCGKPVENGTYYCDNCLTDMN